MVTLLFGLLILVLVSESGLRLELRGRWEEDEGDEEGGCCHCDGEEEVLRVCPGAEDAGLHHVCYGDYPDRGLEEDEGLCLGSYLVVLGIVIVIVVVSRLGR